MMACVYMTASHLFACKKKHCTKIGLRAPKCTMLDSRALLWIPCSYITVPESIKTRYNKKLIPPVPSFFTCFCLRN